MSQNNGGIEKIYKEWPSLAREALKLVVTHELESTALARVVVAGMGGSGIVGDFVQWLARVHGSSIPYDTVKDLGPFPPGWLNASLVFLVSYSGNTVETLRFAQYVLEEAGGDPISSPTMVVAVTSGGRLAELAESQGLPLIRVRGGLLPRASLPLMLLPILRTLVDAEALGGMGMEEVRAGVQALESLGPGQVERAGELSSRLGGWLERGLTPLVAGCGASWPLALRIRYELAENSKVLALGEMVPEAGHNMVEPLARWRWGLGAILVDPGYEPCSGALESFAGVLEEAGVLGDRIVWRRENLGFLGWYLVSGMAWGLASSLLGRELGYSASETPWLRRFRGLLGSRV